MTLELILIVRLAVAGLLGAIIGIDREHRAKEAGIRTHFFVSLGSALFMIVSQYGFAEGLMNLLSSNPDIPMRSDTSRVAAQIVSGIGFIGAGTIILHKRFVVGLTTAAGLWTTSAIGMSIGGGLYLIGTVTTIMTFIGLKSLRMLSHKMGHVRGELRIVYIADNEEISKEIVHRFRSGGNQIASYLAIRDNDRIKTSLTVDFPENNITPDSILTFLQEKPGVTVESIE